MASGKSHGRVAQFTIADSGGTPRDFSGDLSSAELDAATAVAKSTGLGSTDETYLAGLNDQKITLKGFFDDAATTGLYTVLSGIRQASKAFVYGPAGSTSGNVKITGSAILTDFKISSPIGGTVTLDATFQVTGALAFSTY